MTHGGGLGTSKGRFSARVAGGDGRGFVVALVKRRTGTGTVLTEARRRISRISAARVSGVLDLSWELGKKVMPPSDGPT